MCVIDMSAGSFFFRLKGGIGETDFLTLFSLQETPKFLPPSSSLRLEPSLSTLETLDNMPRAENASSSPKHPITYRSWYSDWCKERKPQGLPCSRKDAGVAWRKMSKDEKAKYRAQLHNPPMVFLVTVPSDYLDEDDDEEEDEDEDLIDDLASLNASPIKGEEQLPLSPLFSEAESDVGSSIFGESHPTSPSVLDQGPSTGPRRFVLELPFPGPSSTNEVPPIGPSSNTDQFSSAVPSPSANGPPAHSPQSASRSTPPLFHPIPVNNVANEPDFSLLDEVAYTYQTSLPPSQDFIYPEHEWWGESSYDAMAETHQFSLPTPVPTTPMTGYTALQTPCYTPGLHTQPLPTGLVDTQFLFNNVEAPVVPEQQQTWDNGYGSSECFPQLSVEPPTPAPALAPALAPVPEVGGQFDQMAGFQTDPYQWNGITNLQMFENNQLQVPPAPVFNQNLPLAAVQQVFNAVGSNNLGPEGKRLGLLGVQLWFTPT